MNPPAQLGIIRYASRNITFHTSSLLMPHVSLTVHIFFPDNKLESYSSPPPSSSSPISTPYSHATDPPRPPSPNNVTLACTYNPLPTYLPLNADRPPRLDPGHPARALHGRDPAPAAAPRSSALRVCTHPLLVPLRRLKRVNPWPWHGQSQQCQLQSCQRQQPCRWRRGKTHARPGQLGRLGEPL